MPLNHLFFSLITFDDINLQLPMELCTAVQTINPSSVGCGMQSKQSE